LIGQYVYEEQIETEECHISTISIRDLLFNVFLFFLIFPQRKFEFVFPRFKCASKKEKYDADPWVPRIENNRVFFTAIKNEIF